MTTTQLYSHPDCNEFVRKMMVAGRQPRYIRALGWSGPAVTLAEDREDWPLVGAIELQELVMAEGRYVAPVAVGRVVPRRVSDNLCGVLDDLYELGLIDLPTGISDIGNLRVQTRTDSCAVDITRTLDVFGWAFQCGMPLLSQPMATRMMRRARGIWRGTAARAAQERLDGLWERVA